MDTPHSLSRRQFLHRAGTLAAAAATPAAARAATVPINDKVRLAVVGCGGMGSRHIEALAVNPQCSLAAVCDVAKSRYYDQMDIVEKLNGTRPDGYQDFRHILDRNDIDAVLFATPDHWHALNTILACEAGKDVYVEKPVCVTVTEGRAMVAAARRYGRIVQAGTQQRSMPLFQKAVELIHNGRLGQITTAGAWIGVNACGVGETIEPVPKGLDWDLWLGPAPWVPFSRERFGGFRCFYDYARGGELANWGIHLLDIVHWGIRQDRPLAIQSTGGSYPNAAAADNYETIESIMEYPGCTVTWDQRHQNLKEGRGYGIYFNGTEAKIIMDRGSFKVIPESTGVPEYIGEPERSWANPDHHNNFFHCIRTRNRPAADIEQAFRSTAAILLAGIALKVQRKLWWDGDAERFINDPEADRHLHRAYRAPWHL